MFVKRHLLPIALLALTGAGLVPAGASAAELRSVTADIPLGSCGARQSSLLLDFKVPVATAPGEAVALTDVTASFKWRSGVVSIPGSGVPERATGTVRGLSFTVEGATTDAMAVTAVPHALAPADVKDFFTDGYGYDAVAALGSTTSAVTAGPDPVVVRLDQYEISTLFEDLVAGPTGFPGPLPAPYTKETVCTPTPTASAVAVIPSTGGPRPTRPVQISLPTLQCPRVTPGVNLTLNFEVPETTAPGQSVALTNVSASASVPGRIDTPLGTPYYTKSTVTIKRLSFVTSGTQGDSIAIGGLPRTLPRGGAGTGGYGALIPGLGATTATSTVGRGPVVVRLEQFDLSALLEEPEQNQTNLPLPDSFVEEISCKPAPGSDPLVVIPNSAPPEPVAADYAVTGSATLKSLVKGSVPLKGALNGVAFDAAGAFSGALALEKSSATLTAYGFLPVSAQLQLVATEPLAGTLTTGAVSASTKLRVKLPKVSLLGVQIGGGSNCQAKQLSPVALKSTNAFSAATGGVLAGTFTISDLSGCGALNGLVSPLTAGKGNAIVLNLAPKAATPTV